MSLRPIMAGRLFPDRIPFDPIKTTNVAGFVSGVGSLNPLNWIVKSDDGRSVAVLNEEGAALDAKLKALNDAKYAADKDAVWYAKAEANRKAGVIDASDEVTAAFIEGGGEGLTNMQSAVRSVTQGAFFSALGFIPPIAWVALIVYGAWSLGLFHAGVRVAKRKVASIQ